jgi:lipopolysaccharide/colanic/teichoic acid biosynthesis glycosyltransferase
VVLISATARVLDREVVDTVSPIRLQPFVATRVSGQIADGTPHVVGEGVFRSVLFRESRRADRSNSAFMLLLVTIDGGDSPVRWRQVIAAVSAARRDTDVLGWFEDGRTIGAILPETGLSDASAAASIVARRARRELAKRLDAAAMARVTVRAHVHPDLPQTGAEPLPAAAQPGVRRSVTALAKRGLDIIGSLALLTLFSPALVVIAAVVKRTSRGPIFFRQTRIGHGGRHFTMLKFRTMYADSDSAIHRDYVNAFIKASGNGAGGTMRKMDHDPRITPIGRILRKTSLDELPQFINTLRGEMSLVGPRPPLPYEVEQYKSWHRRRVLDAKPGITGLWQVTGRSRTTFDEMVRLDLRYAKRPSVWTDIKILLATPHAVISGRGAG